jgi:hypothetical protein
MYGLLSVLILLSSRVVFQKTKFIALEMIFLVFSWTSGKERHLGSNSTNENKKRQSIHRDTLLSLQSGLDMLNPQDKSLFMEMLTVINCSPKIVSWKSN